MIYCLFWRVDNSRSAFCAKQKREDRGMYYSVLYCSGYRKVEQEKIPSSFLLAAV